MSVRLPAVDTVESAVLALSPHGYAQRDQEFGNSLADQIRRGRELTDRQRFAARRMLGSYRTQLHGYGIDYDAIPMTLPPPPKVRTRSIELVRDAFVVRFEFNSEISASIRALPDWPRRWDADLRAWVVGNTPDNVIGLAAVMEKHRFSTAGPATAILAAAADIVARQQAEAEVMIAASIAAAADYEVAGLVGELRPYQRAGAKYAVEHRRTFIADEPGVGKTVEGIATVQAMGAYPLVVVCPANVKSVWRDHFRRWVPGKTIKVIEGNAPSSTVQVNLLFSLDIMADVLIVNYDILRTWVPTLRARQPRAVIFDESHYMKSTSTRRTKAGIELAEKQDVVLLLTGTPVMNRPAELASQLVVMGRMAEFAKSPNDFVKRYSGAGRKDDERTAADRRAYVELNDKLRATCFIRRTKAQVMPELPPKQRSVIPIELDNWKDYIAAESEMIRTLIERHRDLAKARAQKVAEDLASIEKLKQLAARGMMAGMGEWIEDFLDSDQKLIVFGWHKAVIHEMADRFDAEEMVITGETPLGERDTIMRSFQEDPAKKLIIGNIQAMGVGVTLTAASTVNFMELGWNPAVHDQAEDRAHRLGQHDSVNANYFIGIGTIYERIMKLIDAKRLVVSAATDGRMAPREQSILSDLIADLTGTPNEDGAA